MKIVLVRHGEPAWVERGKTTNDPGLSPVGVSQAHLLRHRLKDLVFDQVWTSRVRRAIHTTSVVVPGRAVTHYGWLDELRQPLRWHGQPNLEEVFADLREFRARDRHHQWDGIEGGEDLHEFFDRVTEGFDETLQDEMGVYRRAFGYLRSGGEGKRLLIVGHHGVLSSIIAHCLNNGVFPQDLWDRYQMAFTSVSQLSLVPSGGQYQWSLDYLNDVTHLDGVREANVHGVVVG